MVERPIKKSERQAQAGAEGNSENQLDSKDSADFNRGRGKGKKERSSGRGKKSSADEFKPPVNPALQRPPKPAKPPVKKEVEPEPEAETAVAVEESQEPASES